LQLVCALPFAVICVAMSGCAGNRDDELMRSLRSRDWQRYQSLLSDGADPNSLDRRGVAVTLFAANVDASKWLREALRHGGNPNLANVGDRESPGRTPLFYAIGGLHRSENVRLLIAAKADLNPTFRRSSPGFPWGSRSGESVTVFAGPARFCG
jgi:ankyrin repeat protein